MTRDELKSLIVELMRQYDDEEIDGATYYKGLQTIKYTKRIEDNVEVENSEK